MRCVICKHRETKPGTTTMTLEIESDADALHGDMLENICEEHRRLF